MTPEEFDEIMESETDTPELWAMAALAAMKADYEERAAWLELFHDIAGPHV